MESTVHICGTRFVPRKRAPFRAHRLVWQKKRCPPGGPQNGPNFSAVFPFFGHPQALAAWRWANFWEGLCPESKRVIFVNIDETSVPLREAAGRGYAHIPPGEARAQILAAEQKCTLAQRRSDVSLVAMLSDDSAAQVLLPQILVTHERTLSKEARAKVQAHLHESTTLFLWRRRSAWVDGAAMVRILTLLKEASRPLWCDVHVVLFLDCSPVHAGKKVVAAASRMGFRLVMIPSSMTGVLQPLDVYCFAGLKKRHREGVAAHALRDPRGTVSPATVCRTLFAAVQSFVAAGVWEQAFRGCGFGARQTHLGERAKRKLLWPTGPPPVGDTLPSLRDLETVWLRGKSVPIETLFRPAVCAIEGAEPVAGDPPGAARSPWRGRLRSSSAQSLRAPSPQNHPTTSASSGAGASWTRGRIPRGVRLWGRLPPEPRR